MNATKEKVDGFFERYATALLARDAAAIAGMYAVPSLILFPGTSIPVSDPRQTEEFFASAFSQYAGVNEIEKRTAILGEAPGTVWADVTWSYGGTPRERFCYQLIDTADGYRIAVLTLMV
ncbi:MAG: hypothetical protein ABWX85_06300 [Arthrobacter sp.]